MPIIDDKEYDALLYAAMCIELCHKNIAWDVPEIQAKGKSGTTLESDGDACEEKKKRENSAPSSKRSRFKAKASKYTVGVGEKRRKALLKEGKPVLRKDPDKPNQTIEIVAFT